MLQRSYFSDHYNIAEFITALPRPHISPIITVLLSSSLCRISQTFLTLLSSTLSHSDHQGLAVGGEEPAEGDRHLGRDDQAAEARVGHADQRAGHPRLAAREAQRRALAALPEGQAAADPHQQWQQGL